VDGDALADEQRHQHGEGLKVRGQRHDETTGVMTASATTMALV
jgi:hypothetical protein